MPYSKISILIFFIYDLYTHHQDKDARFITLGVHFPYKQLQSGENKLRCSWTSWNGHEYDEGYLLMYVTHTPGTF